MRLERRDRFSELEALLWSVEKPVRYLDHEWGACADQEGPFHVCLLYPDVYEVGQPNLGLSILYGAVNAAEGLSCERSYLPWTDLIDLMRANDVPLLSLETSSPVASFDVVGFTLAHELACTNILEALDLARIPLRSCERAEDDAIVVAGGPSVWNCEPVAPVFDAILLGDGEEALVEMCRVVREGRAARRCRRDILRALARVQGVYVPALYDVVVDERSTRWGRAVPRPGEDVPHIVLKRSLARLDRSDPLPQKIVPYLPVVQDRLAIEVLRGCCRGCRFCQAGMTYRPVRERPAKQVVAAACDGLTKLGHDEVSLTSLSTTDHSQCAAILHELNAVLRERGVRVSIPSQRLDSFGVDMAAEGAGSKRGGLTFAPEAGSQRLRDVINKNVTDEDIDAAAANAFRVGWRRMKLYFMMGLPTETDEDVLGIARTAARVLELGRSLVGRAGRSKVSVSVSVAVLVPKAHTPFQWAGQLPLAQLRRRQELLLAANRDRAVKISYHDAEVSQVEAVLSRMGRQGFELILEAWRRGCRFDAWMDQFCYEGWVAAAGACGLDLDEIASTPLPVDASLPWDHTSPGVSKGYLQSEWRRAQEGLTTPDCTMTACTGCGVCPVLGVDHALAGERHAQ
ncbi:TIGR03960 family B12-binding radical SAM protein [Olsenella sp. HMSC062G07]|uniref:TIGR03960 family B12-binding radical SAM protein n=1 Tax=Olsenella sp. HMSC062G07 TaxID=1739330 RepID=UPI0008A20004|nr:TIGR03960 family B12-binding radical SAM protein [Olsenella sp. HMSC062G07]OFK24311.1 B12-binding protein [Olsenella sp. HMSC062G07]